jgi:hypothetical protein
VDQIERLVPTSDGGYAAAIGRAAGAVITSTTRPETKSLAAQT